MTTRRGIIGSLLATIAAAVLGKSQSVKAEAADGVIIWGVPEEGEFLSNPAWGLLPEIDPACYGEPSTPLILTLDSSHTWTWTNTTGPSDYPWSTHIVERVG